MAAGAALSQFLKGPAPPNSGAYMYMYAVFIILTSDCENRPASRNPPVCAERWSMLESSLTSSRSSHKQRSWCLTATSQRRSSLLSFAALFSSVLVCVGLPGGDRVVLGMVGWGVWEGTSQFLKVS